MQDWSVSILHEGERLFYGTYQLELCRSRRDLKNLEHHAFFSKTHTPHRPQDMGQTLCKEWGSGSFTSLLSTQILSPDMSSPRTTIFTPPFILPLVCLNSSCPLARPLRLVLSHDCTAPRGGRREGQTEKMKKGINRTWPMAAVWGRQCCSTMYVS